MFYVITGVMNKIVLGYIVTISRYVSDNGRETMRIPEKKIR